jgi:ABC-type dipeptide/oligopeptide/nickel transport system permease subunit
MIARSLSTLAAALESRRGAVAGAWLLIVIVGAIAAPLLTPYRYDIQALTEAFQGPSAVHLLGTDEFGRDLLTRLLYGARTSLSVSTVAIGLSVTSGLVLGAIAGYFGGRIDRAVTAVVDLSWSFPEILLALILVAIIGPGVTGTLFAIGVAYLAQFTRLVRSQILSLRSETFVEAARSLGATDGFILINHLIPNALAPVLVAAMLATGDAIILEATLGFFGLGAQPPTPSWGAMMSSGTAQLFRSPGIIIFPGLAVAITVIAINIFGDALVKAMDVRGKARTA